MKVTAKYVPILAAKAGELAACAKLKPASKAMCRPIMVLPKPDWDYVADAPKFTMDEQIVRLSDAIAKQLNTTVRASIDTSELDTAALSPRLGAVMKALRSANAPQVPVTGLWSRPNHDEEVKACIKEDKLGACLRVADAGAIEVDQLEGLVDAVLKRIDTDPPNVDLVIDLGPIDQGISAWIVRSLPDFIASIPKLSAWRSLAVCATSFPENLALFPGSTISELPRLEWKLWRSLKPRLSKSRMPIFGDYAIAHPERSELDPRLMKPSASLRYTGEDVWHIAKGVSYPRDSKQMHRICKKIIKEAWYSGPTASEGDQWIQDCAQTETGPGNLTTYRRVGTNHHIEFVLSQLERLP